MNIISQHLIVPSELLDTDILLAPFYFIIIIIFLFHFFKFFFYFHFLLFSLLFNMPSSPYYLVGIFFYSLLFIFIYLFIFYPLFIFVELS
jgi:hypothetical protein